MWSCRVFLVSSSTHFVQRAISSQPNRSGPTAQTQLDFWWIAAGNFMTRWPIHGGATSLVTGDRIFMEMTVMVLIHQAKSVVPLVGESAMIHTACVGERLKFGIWNLKVKQE